ncbi:peptidoglycan recognition protein family protein [Paenibacillus tengchongensis]|uniref:peptidoglycan recognition protein family protein n=1 Tax=Paenibacillus tengchongensis TaxID=2608684 RepID=UPI00124C13A0|nr:peptidoglycan recognition family protein [Paenibacillus tengchongensis]
MSFKNKYPIEQRWLPKGSKRRSGLNNAGIRFVVAHDTGNDGSTAGGNVNYYINSAHEQEASAHVFIDHQSIIECIPLNEKAWHVLYNTTADNVRYGCNANDAAIGVELCYSSRAGGIDNAESYKRYVWYMAYLCHKFNLDPFNDIAGHNELDPARKSDPFRNALKIMNITKERFLQDVADEWKACTSADPADQTICPEEEEPMKLEKWANDMLIAALSELKAKGYFTDANWIEKAKSQSLTAAELAFLNTILISKTVK